MLGPACRFEPSCSRYMVEALRKYGLIRGLAKGTAADPRGAIPGTRAGTIPRRGAEGEPKQVRRIFLTLRSLVSILSSGGGRDEPVETQTLATPSSPSAAQGHIGRPHVSEDLGRAGTRPRAIRRRTSPPCSA